MIDVPPDDRLRLSHMRDACDEVTQFVAGKSRVDLDTDRLLFRGLCMSIGIIGEAASNVSAGTREKYPNVPWRNIRAMRNFLFHGYFEIDADVLWQTATVSVPELRQQIA